MQSTFLLTETDVKRLVKSALNYIQPQDASLLTELNPNLHILRSCSAIQTLPSSCGHAIK